MFPGMEMCAKTGTAEVGEGKQPHGWMVGFSQDKNFPYAFAVIVENSGFGIKTAGPIASDVMKSLHRKWFCDKNFMTLIFDSGTINKVKKFNKV